MIADFDDFCLQIFVLIDDLWPQIAPLLRRPGPEPDCSDSELITMTLVGECRGWDEETVLLANWKEHPHLFPIVPEHTRYNRRRRNLAFAINLLRQLTLCDLAYDGQLVIDSLPLPVVGFHLAPGANGDWDEQAASYGHCASKKQTIYGYKLHLLMTLSGVIVNFSLAPAHESDLAVGAGLMRELHRCMVIGDKGYISKPLQEELVAQEVRLLTPTRRNQKEQLPKAAAKHLNGARQIVETVNSQLAEQFHIERNHASSFRGLMARLYRKLAAHTLCIKLNRLLGNPNFLHIKELAYPV